MNCKICKNIKNHKMFQVKEMMFGYRDIFEYFLCTNCGCLQILDIPKNLDRYYPEQYYSYNKKINSERKIESLLKKKRDTYLVFHRGILGKFINMLFPNNVLNCINYTRADYDTKILDVGCGNGALLKSLDAIGFKKLLGIDAYIEQEIYYASGLQILKKEIFDLDTTWDIIMLHHSFEHMPEQLKTLEKISELLGADGCCIIRIPTTSSYAWKKYNVNWVQIDAPRHLFIHSIESFNILASQAGLKIERIVYDSTSFQFWGSEQYKEGIPLTAKQSYWKDRRRSIFSQKQILEYRRQSKKLNQDKQGDQAIFYLRIDSI